MAKLTIILTLFCFSTLIGNSESLLGNSKTILPPPPVASPLRVYLFEVAAGPNATLFPVARASISSTINPISFGIVYVVDDVVRAGPFSSSQQLARNQGTITITGLYTPPSAVLNYNFIFTSGNYNGSTLQIAGQRLILGKNQEVPIVGGTGALRGARGYTLSSFISFNPITSTYLFVFDIYLTGVSILG